MKSVEKDSANCQNPEGVQYNKAKEEGRKAKEAKMGALTTAGLERKIITTNQ